MCVVNTFSMMITRRDHRNSTQDLGIGVKNKKRVGRGKKKSAKFWRSSGGGVRRRGVRRRGAQRRGVRPAEGGSGGGGPWDGGPRVGGPGAGGRGFLKKQRKK